MTTGRSSATEAARAGDRPEPVFRGVVGAASSRSGTRMTEANRKNASPRVRNASPTDATFAISGIGIGMTSDSGPRWRRKDASSGGGRMTWMTPTSSGVRPAAMRAGSQIGI
jgi:hypothetical protein